MRSAILHHSRTLAVALATLGATALIGAGAASAQAPGTLSVVADTVSSHEGCVQTNVFQRSDLVVFRAEALLAGKIDTNAKLAVHIAGGPTLPMTYGAHGSGPNAPHFWSAAWPLPMNEPTGIVSYTITATDGSLTATFKPFPVPPSMLTVIPYTYQVSVTATPAGKDVDVAASVVQPVTDRSGKTTLVPMTTGGAVAILALQGDVNAKGALVAQRQVTLHYDKSARQWVGILSASGLKPGLYVVQVNAHDAVATPNTGSATSPAFNLG